MAETTRTVAGQIFGNPVALAADIWDVIVIGAGAAGLAAYRDLSRAGSRVLCLEARDRVGGRVLTVRDPLAPIPVELGAEFIHGQPPETWDVVRSGALAVYDCAENAVRIKRGEPQGDVDSWELVGDVLQGMQSVAEQEEDQTFQHFIANSSHSEDAKQWAASYVEGFNAARKEVIGIHSLAQDAKAADDIGGEQSYRILSGYDALVLNLMRGAETANAQLNLGCIVERVEWQKGAITVHFRRGLKEVASESAKARRLVVTVPLGVLQTDNGALGAIRFDPPLTETMDAARQLAFGQVIRVVFRFREAFWESKPHLHDAGFFLSNEEFFPTWWTPLPVRAPLITGWSAGPRADRLAAQSREEIGRRALADLARVTATESHLIDSLFGGMYFHDWHHDPFARGAYSYVPAGKLAARSLLAKPVADTIYFAGEATELNGHSATVHGAIATGRRAAREVIP